MTYQINIPDYIDRFYGTAARLAIDPLFLDALLHAPHKEPQLSEDEFLLFCLSQLAESKREEALEDMRSAEAAVRVQAKANLEPAKRHEIRRLSAADRRILALYNQKWKYVYTVQRLHLSLLPTIRRDLATLMTRFESTSFQTFLSQGIGPHLAGIVQLRDRLNEQHETGNRDAGDRNNASDHASSPMAASDPQQRATTSGHRLLPLTIILAEQMNLIRECIGILLNTNLGDACSIIGEATSGEELMELLKTSQPRLAIIDSNLRQPGSIETTTLIKQRYPNVRVLVLCDNNHFCSFPALVRAGADGLVAKGGPVREVVRAIRLIHEGERYYSNVVLQGVD